MQGSSPAAIRLTPSDTARLRILRAEALVNDPWSFGPTPGEDLFECEERARGVLADPIHAVFGVEDGAGPAHPLVAFAGVMRSTRAKQSHVASIWGVYTTPAFRRRGCSRAIMRACIDHARAWSGVTQLALSVSERAPEARALYESLGFRTWGIEPDCVRIGAESGDERYMQLAL
jgi:RimJ/RimL family protein N-acetyltransferase